MNAGQRSPVDAAKLREAALDTLESLLGGPGAKPWSERAAEHARQLLALLDAEPIGYAVRMADGPFVGVWQVREIAESVCAKQPPGHGDVVVPVYAAPVGERTREAIASAAAEVEAGVAAELKAGRLQAPSILRRAAGRVRALAPEETRDAG